MKAVSRRKVISTLATGGASLALAGFLRADVASGQTTRPVAKAFQGQHTPKPLPFDPAKLKGLSEKLIRSHWENNYGGAVKALNTIEQRLAAMLPDKDLPPYIYGDLKREELVRTGSVVLHENYFANLGGDGKASGKALDLLKQWLELMSSGKQSLRRPLTRSAAVQAGPFCLTTCTRAKFTITGRGIICITRRWVIRYWYSTCTNTLITWTTERLPRSTSMRSCKT